MSKKLRTPIIMPRKQGGTFYTFGSAMEDIGLNINESHNKVEISHYVLLDLPKFANNLSTSETYLNLNSEMDYKTNEHTKDSSAQGDFVFADSFQDYCLNFETVLRNQDEYNYASNKTVSERVFWKWLFGRMKNDNNRFVTDGDYIYEGDKDKAIAKAFGAISAGSQRTDDSGLYNETFVQIPSSYGQMRVLFKKVIDENYIDGRYQGYGGAYIENIDESEITDIVIDNIVIFHMYSEEFSYPSTGSIITESTTEQQFKVVDSDKIDRVIVTEYVGDVNDIPYSGNLVIDGEEQQYESFENYTQKVIKSTGISPCPKRDNVGDYIVKEDYDKFEVEFDINKLRSYYGNDTLTYDDIGIGNTGDTDVDVSMYGDFTFNAILIYYSIYDTNKTKRLATNAYGIYILDNAIESSDIEGMFYFPSILKAKSKANKNGSSYSFRINVKPSTAYSGDITVNDNSTAGYSMSEDFNDVLRNLTSATTTMKENTKLLYSISNSNKDIKKFVSATMEKIDGIESDITNIKNGNFPYTASEIYKEENEKEYDLTPSIAKAVLDAIHTTYDRKTGKLGIKIDTSDLTGIPLAIANSLETNIKDNNYIDVMSIVTLLVSRSSGTIPTNSKKVGTIASNYDENSPLVTQAI